MNLSAHKDSLAAMPCLLARDMAAHCTGRVHLHHVAEGSGLRNDWALVPLCEGHHTGPAGLHGMGTKAFLRLYRPPGDSEFGLLVWLIEAMVKARTY